MGYTGLTMDASDLPQLARETLGLLLTMAGLVAATYCLFSL